MTDQHALDQDETAVRAMLRKLGARPAGHAVDGEEQPAPAAVAVPPRPDYAPDVPAPGPPGSSAPRVPDWWEKDKPPLDAEPTAAAPAAEEPATGEDPADQPENAERDQEPAEQPTRRPRPRMSKVEKRARADDPDDLGEEDGENPEDDDQAVGERKPGKWATQLRRPHRETTRPPFATAVPLYRDVEKRSLAEMVHAIPAHKKWLLYAGSGFATGWYFGIPQFARDATASVAQHSGPLQDNPDIYFWGIAAVVAISLDRATRRSWFLIAWATRGLTVCIALGALLYGNDLPR
ncbi:hypothetical protein DIZ27_38905 [Streptomyces sp. NWU339]|uniref:hypothetical protein n=1 Tax=Streptomyces sp. NWU339 TaxID=2185284 RepID=UPI000D67AA11|nr:hypothetical protein [Streptomyces sp. NWU339]PWI05505.1 hypothetical protein DIZ27_38905 [Streptomyces sp. NWU339]